VSIPASTQDDLIAVDSSAIICILLKEDGCEAIKQRLASATLLSMSAVSLPEAGMVASGRTGDEGLGKLHELIVGLKIAVSPFDRDQALAAIAAFQRFGKGRHPARLNMGDCATYAFAQTFGLPLLYKGNDFAATDARPAAAPHPPSQHAAGPTA